MARDKNKQKLHQQQSQKVVASKSKFNYKLWLSLVVAIFITLFCYKGSFKAGYTNWDDPVYVRENEAITSMSKNNVKHFFTDIIASNYHPLTMLTLAWDYSRAKINPSQKEKSPYTFHQTNILLHLFNVFLVFFFIYYLSSKKWLVAFIAALLFGVHPMHVESVSWISERKDVLYAFFFLSSLIAYLKYLNTKKLWAYFACLILFVLSVLSKPAAVPMGIVLLLLDYYYNRLDFSFTNLSTYKNLAGKKSMMIFAEKIPFLICAVFVLFRTFKAQEHSAIGDFAIFTIYQRFVFASYGFLMYLEKLAIPTNLSAFYPYPFVNTSGYLPFYFYLMPLIALVMLVVVFWTEKKTKLLVFGLLFYLVMVIMVLQFVSVGKAIMADRYSYISYIGIFFIIGEGFNFLWNSKEIHMKNLRIITAILLAFYCVMMIITATQRTAVWKDSETLWTDVMQKYPQVEESYKNRGNYYGKELNQPEKALKDYEVLMGMNFKDKTIFCNLGNIYAMLGKYDKSIDSYSKALKLDSTNYGEAYLNRAITYARIKQYDKAISDYNKSDMITPNEKIMYENRGYTYLEMKEYNKSIADFNYLINRYPNDPQYYFNRGMGYFYQANYKDAIADYTTCISLNPNNPDYYFNRAVCAINANNIPASCSDLQTALQLGHKGSKALIDKYCAKK